MIHLSVRRRIVEHVDYLKEHVEIADENDSKTFENVYTSFTHTARKLRAYQVIRTAIATLLYISIITTLAKGVSPEIAQIISPLVALSGLIGTAVLTVLYFIMSHFIKLVLNDLLTEHTHLVALLVKHNNEFIAHPGYEFGIIKHYE